METLSNTNLSNGIEITHSCNFSSIACIKTNILKQHIKNVHRKNENTPCQFCKDTFMISCLKSTRIVKREKLEEKSGSNNPKVTSSYLPLKSESFSGNSKPNDFLFESEFLNNNFDVKEEKKIDIIKDDTTNVKMNKIKLISPVVSLIISNAILISEKSKEEESLRCEICDQSFKSPDIVKKHVQSVHGENYEMQCTICCRYFSLHSIFEHSKYCLTGPQKCNTCGKVFKSKSKLDSHKAFKHELEPGKCQKCNKTYKRPADLAVHKRRHHNEAFGIYKCDICGSTFTQKDSLKRHNMLGRHQKPKNYPCQQCSVSFESEKALESHNSFTHSSGLTNLTKCDICSKGLMNEATLRFHKRKLHPELNIKEMCYMCQKEFKTKGAVQKHIMQDHNGYKCLRCGKKFRDEYIYQIHIKKVHEGAIGQKCDFCDYTAININHFKVHVRKNHTEKKQFQCSDCNRIFNRKYNLTSHVKSVHQKIKDKKCPHCEATFSRADNLNTHVTSAHGTIENLVCDQCGKHFMRHDALKEHILGVHENKINLLCELCGKSFLRKRRLRLHLNKVHKLRFTGYDVTLLGEKSKLCNYCGKSFNHAKSLSKHLKGVHKVEESDQYTNNKIMKNEDVLIRNTELIVPSKKTNQRPWIYKCESCLDVFEGQHKYHNHILSVHPEKHKCMLCGKCFSEKFYLSQHMKAHQNRDCQICKMSFLTSGHLKSHVAEFHNGLVKETSKS